MEDKKKKIKKTDEELWQEAEDEYLEEKERKSSQLISTNLPKPPAKRSKLITTHDLPAIDLTKQNVEKDKEEKK